MERTFQYGIYLSALMGATVLGSIYYLAHYPPLMLELGVHMRSGCPSIVLDNSGAELFRFQREHAVMVPLAEIPDTIKEAFIAAEDRAFYHHAGISWFGILRSLWYNIYYRKFAQGASTITQQLVRLLLGDVRKTLLRKLKEQLYALILERQFSKDQILEAYLNTVYFGCSIYGIRAIVARLWGAEKLLSEVTADEAAVLAGIVQSPRLYCPLLQPLNALKRRNMVLRSMESAGYLSAAAREELRQRPLKLHVDAQGMGHLFHLRDMVSAFLEERFGKEALYQGGMVIKTTIDSTMQRTAHDLFTAHIATLRERSGRKGGTVDGALVTLSAQGAIRALVGGTTQFNRAVHARRQIGSTIKPLLYAASGRMLYETEVDEPMVLTDGGVTWRPTNVTRTFEGQMSLARALMVSNNSISIKIWQMLGAEKAMQLLRDAGITACVRPYPSLALGCVDTSPLEVAGMFQVIARQGLYTQPYLVQWVKDKDGTLLWRHKPVTRQVVPWRASSAVLQVLEQAAQRWLTKVGLPALPCSFAAKSGTTDSTRNCWMAFATPCYTTVVFLGADDYSPLENLYAVRHPFSLCIHLNRAIEQPVAAFSYDPELVPVRIDGITGERLAPDDTRTNALTVLVPGF